MGSEQEYHFKCLFQILADLGYKWAKDCYHLSYGMVYLPEGKMKSREGKIVDADDLIAEMKKLAAEEIRGVDFFRWVYRALLSVCLCQDFRNPRKGRICKPESG